jgi:hypothetical protein
MVNGALVLSRTTGSSAALMRRFRIGEHELCEPDYQQILLWAKSLELEPETVIERLPKERNGRYGLGKIDGTVFENGRIIKLEWDFDLLPIDSFGWVKGLLIQTIDCGDCRLIELDLSAVPLLTDLGCSDNELTELDIRPLWNLTELSYDKDKTRLIQRPDQNF